MIYLDYSANTPCSPLALDAFVETERNYPANPNSNHPAGLSARAKMDEVTVSAASLFGVLPSDIIWTSGASEANNLAIKGIARAMRNHGKHIISTPLEHPSVSGPLTWLQEQGYEIDLVDIERDGKISLESLKDLIRDDTVLVAVSAVDSELGVIQPIDKISEIVRQYPNCLLHVDATQAIGKTDFSFDGIDTASLTAHKFYGPNGIGLLYKRAGLVIEPLIHGGSGSSLYRSGTPTLSLAASLNKALSEAIPATKDHYDYVKGLNTYLREELLKYPDVRINSPEDAVPHILNLSVNGIKGTLMQSTLSEHGVCVSVKSACATDGTPSRAVFAVSKDRRNALSSWRISLSHLTTMDEINEFLDIFDKSLKELKS